MAARGATIALARPGRDAIAAFVAEQRALDLSYVRPPGGIETPPPGFVVDRRRVEVGRGDADFAAASDVLRRWKMFDIGWIDIQPDTTPIVVGNVVAVVMRIGPTWWLNAARIVDVVETTAPPRRFGFSYGTLPGHIESGEERFLVEQTADGTVWYDLRAFSRPQSRLVRLGYPVARTIQRHAGARSTQVVRETVARRRATR